MKPDKSVRIGEQPLRASTATQVSPPTQGNKLDDPKRFITRKELAKRTGMSVSFFNQRAVKGGGPPMHKFGTRVRYLLQEVYEWQEERRVRSTSASPGSSGDRKTK